MIRLTRRQLRQFGEVMRESLWAVRDRQVMPPILVSAGPGGVTLSSQCAGYAVSFTDGEPQASEAIALPAHVLHEVEGDDGLVLLEPVAPLACQVIWQRGSEGWRRTMDCLDPAHVPPFRTLPYLRNALDENQVVQLHQAMLTARDWSLAVQLRASGAVAATDGKQILLQSGFHFPWPEDVLIPPTRIFGCSPFRFRPVSIGRTAHHVVVQTDRWTVALPIVHDRTFPKLEVFSPASRCLGVLLRGHPRAPPWTAGKTRRQRT